jgi:hypothetical protein
MTDGAPSKTENTPTSDGATPSRNDAASEAQVEPTTKTGPTIDDALDAGRAEADALPTADAQRTDADPRDGTADAPEISSELRDAAADVPSEARPPVHCSHPIDDRWSYGLATTSAPWHRAFGDPHIDTAAEQLFLTYDDVVQRTPVSGSYYFSFDLDLDSDVTFYVGISNAWVLQPAIARSGSELMLSGAYYSMAGLQSVGTFTGQRLPAGRLHVTFFANAVTRKVALHVVAGRERRASGFVPVGEDVGGVLLIGNNAGAGNGPARIGRLEGCAELDPSEIEAAYGSLASD